MKSVFYSIEKGEKWLTPFEKRQWREKYKSLQLWFQNKGIEISPWLQIRLRELLIVTFFIQRLEQELLSPTFPQKESVGVGTTQKTERISSSVQCYEVLCKYLERQRKLVQEFETVKPIDIKTSSMSIAELVQDLLCCAHELDKGNGTMQKNFVEESKNEILLNHDN